MTKYVWLLSLFSIGCSSEKETGEEEGNSVFDNNDTDGNPSSGCPSDVPEEYKYLWDCENAEGCSGKLYRYGVGSSDEDGNITVTEKWFMFEGPDTYCVDTFEITGSWSPLEPEARGCATCESIYEIDWVMQDAQCGVLWSPMFADQEASAPESQNYGGFLLFDTHGGWDIRNEDYGMLVTGTPVNGSSYAPNANYARGTAIPTYEGATPPEEPDPLIDEQQAADYVWANSGDCLQ